LRPGLVWKGFSSISEGINFPQNGAEYAENPQKFLRN